MEGGTREGVQRGVVGVSAVHTPGDHRINYHNNAGTARRKKYINYKIFLIFYIMQEIFKSIPLFPGYEVSNFGTVKSLVKKVRYVHAVTREEHFRETSELILKQYMGKFGYLFVQLRRHDKKVKNKPIHLLVAETFLIRHTHHEVVNHIDGNKTNNHVSNLEWCTRRQNVDHAMKSGLIAKGERVGTSKLNNHSILAIKNLIKDGHSHVYVSRLFGVSRATISLIHEGKTWKHL